MRLIYVANQGSFPEIVFLAVPLQTSHKVFAVVGSANLVDHIRNQESAVMTLLCSAESRLRQVITRKETTVLTAAHSTRVGSRMIAKISHLRVFKVTSCLVSLLRISRPIVPCRFLVRYGLML